MLQFGSNRILLDCGLFQGRRQQAEERNRRLGFDPQTIDAVLLSHAHVDHSGALPLLTKGHFKGQIYMTSATADLTRIMLEDSARLQKADCTYLNKKDRRRGKRPCLQPYYTNKDVQAITRRFETIRYDKIFSVSSRIKARFIDTGHILGSAAIWMKYTSQGHSRTILFSGDLGRPNMPILRDPAPPPSCDVLILESTYGDRVHDEDLVTMTAKAEQILKHAQTHRSKIIVPAFAIGRTQELVMRIKELVKTGRVSPLPIYIDSPLASKATNIFRRHPECFDEETYRTFTSQGDPFAAKYIRYVETPQESQRLNTMRGPCVIISASGMCEGGRILHHLKHAIQDAANIVAIVGFQAEHTLGRKLVEEWDTVPIFGVPIPRRAQIVRFNGLSAHGDRNDLLQYVRSIDPPPEKIFVVHGEERQSFSLATALMNEYPRTEVVVPEAGSTHTLQGL